MSSSHVSLLWDPLPDPVLPTRGLFGRLRRLAASWSRDASLGLSGLSGPQLQELVDLRVRRGFAQALVRHAYQATIAEQDTNHRRPEAFNHAWKDHLASLLDSPTVDLDGWRERDGTDIDVDLAWSLFEAASRARLRTLDRVQVTPSKQVQNSSGRAPVLEFLIVGDDHAELGKVKYGVCSACRVGLLYKIGFPPDWQFCGLGRLALGQLEARHPGLTWHTTGQFSHARGFYDRYRQDSTSPWTAEQHPCSHFQ